MSKRRSYISLLCAVFTFFSCEKVIDLDLKNADPKIVIEGIINNLETPATVKLTQTTAYDATNNFPPIINAVVVLADDMGNSETLSETGPGIYKTSALKGVPGRTYTMTVDAEGETYTATSTMPHPVNIDTVMIVETTRWGESVRGALVQFQDPVDRTNYYRFSLIRNEEPFTSIFLLEDNLYNGTYMEYDIAQASEDPLEEGDNIRVSMYCIDPNVYSYFLTIPSNWEPPANPANPTSNISNGALGYFSAETVSGQNIVVQ